MLDVQLFSIQELVAIIAEYLCEKPDHYEQSWPHHQWKCENLATLTRSCQPDLEAILQVNISCFIEASKLLFKTTSSTHVLEKLAQIPSRTTRQEVANHITCLNIPMNSFGIQLQNNYLQQVTFPSLESIRFIGLTKKSTWISYEQYFVPTIRRVDIGGAYNVAPSAAICHKLRKSCPNIEGIVASIPSKNNVRALSRLIVGSESLRTLVVSGSRACSHNPASDNCCYGVCLKYRDSLLDSIAQHKNQLELRTVGYHYFMGINSNKSTVKLTNVKNVKIHQVCSRAAYDCFKYLSEMERVHVTSCQISMAHPVIRAMTNACSDIQEMSLDFRTQLTPHDDGTKCAYESIVTPREINVRMIHGYDTWDLANRVASSLNGYGIRWLKQLSLYSENQVLFSTLVLIGDNLQHLERLYISSAAGPVQYNCCAFPCHAPPLFPSLTEIYPKPVSCCTSVCLNKFVRHHFPKLRLGNLCKLCCCQVARRHHRHCIVNRYKRDSIAETVVS